MTPNGTGPSIFVLDERPAGLRKDWSNIDHPDVPIISRVGKTAEVFIRITDDGVWVEQGVGKVMLHATKTEAQESLEHAQEHKKMRLGESLSEHDRTASLDKAFEALGTDQPKRLEIMRGAHLADGQ
jgi:hypothetical protein